MASPTLQHTASSGIAACTPPTGAYCRYGKRLFDLAVILPLLPVALAFGLPIALLNAIVFRDPRRVFFVQERVGLRGRPFQLIKFRTMREPRDTVTESWFSGSDAARVTGFGRFLRNTHLDELPQLLNILRGDMHLVGPRPEMPDVHDWACREVPGFEARLAIRPGLTGLAQVTQGYTGASADSYVRKLGIDTTYIEGLSLRTDLEVVLRTIPWMMQGRGWQWNRGGKAAEQPRAAETALPDPEITPAPAPSALTRRDRNAPNTGREHIKVDVA